MIFLKIARGEKTYNGVCIMALLDRFKKQVLPRKERIEKHTRPSRSVGGVLRQTPGETKPSSSPSSSPTVSQGTKKRTRATKSLERRELFQILIKPHVSEKATVLSGNASQYTFRVLERAGKTLVKEAVEALYGVTVEKVRIVSIPRKRKMWRRRTGFTSGYKKAIVTLGVGEKIDVSPH